MLSPNAPLLDITDQEFIDEREKNRILVYRALNTIQSIYNAEAELGNLKHTSKEKVDYYISSLRAINLLIDIFSNKENNVEPLK
jgi:hypothetical protein